MSKVLKKPALVPESRPKSDKTDKEKDKEKKKKEKESKETANSPPKGSKGSSNVKVGAQAKNPARLSFPGLSENNTKVEVYFQNIKSMHDLFETVTLQTAGTTFCTFHK